MGKAERLATSLSDDDLAWSDTRTKAIDYVAAMSASSRLGSDLFRAADHDRQALRRAVLQLMALARRKLGRKRMSVTSAQAQTLALVAIIELLAPYCRTCGGAREIFGGEIKVTCPTCEGIGVHRYSDKDRAKASGIAMADWAKWQGRYEIFLSIASRHYVAAPIDALNRLG